MGLHLGHHWDYDSGVHPAPTHHPPLRLSLLCLPTGSPWTGRPGFEQFLSSSGLLLLPNLPVPQLLTGKQLGETEAGRHQTCPRLLLATELETEARSPGSCVHLRSKLI